MAKDKYLERALKSLNIKINDSNYTDKTIENANDIDDCINSVEQLKDSLEYQIIEVKETLIQLEQDKKLLETIKHQIKVERYKELNPNREVF